MLTNSGGQKFRHNITGMACLCSTICQSSCPQGEWNHGDKYLEDLFLACLMSWLGTQSCAWLGLSPQVLSALWLGSRKESLETEHSKRARQKLYVLHGPTVQITGLCFFYTLSSEQPQGPWASRGGR